MNGGPLHAFPGFCVSVVATITAWQGQLEFWLRIAATLVAITAGLVSIYVALRRGGPPPPPAE